MSPDVAAAQAKLRQAARPATFGTLGGQRPPDTRLCSWWGGNFLGPVPDGTQMTPICQIEIAALPEATRSGLSGAYLQLWINTDAPLHDVVEGRDFMVRTLNVAPADPPPPSGKRQKTKLPVFPIYWSPAITDYPVWEEYSGFINADDDGDWFADVIAETPPPEFDIKVGGWPQWFQGSETPPDAQFVLELRSSDKGRFYVGGSMYLFRKDDRWLLFWDLD